MIKKIILFITVSIMISCSAPDKWKRYSIDEGKHFSSGTNIYYHKSNIIEFDFKFDNTSIYEIGYSQVNKLYGLCPGINILHESYRFGWKCVDEKIQIFAMIHDEGSTIKKHLADIEINTINSAKIELVDSGGYFTLNDKIEFIKFNTDYDDKYLVLLPYFGGKVPAPHDMSIFVKQLN